MSTKTEAKISGTEIFLLKTNLSLTPRLYASVPWTTSCVLGVRNRTSLPWLLVHLDMEDATNLVNMHAFLCAAVHPPKCIFEGSHSYNSIVTGRSGSMQQQLEHNWNLDNYIFCPIIPNACSGSTLFQKGNPCQDFFHEHVHMHFDR